MVRPQRSRDTDADGRDAEESNERHYEQLSAPHKTYHHAILCKTILLIRASQIEISRHKGGERSPSLSTRRLSFRRLIPENRAVRVAGDGLRKLGPRHGDRKSVV